MALKFNWKKNLPRIIWGTILLILAICLIKVAVWEKDYYSGMEGTTRATAITNTAAPTEASEDVDETERTEEDRAAWKVDADKPRFLTIEKLGIDRARVLEMGINKNGQLQTPNNIFDVGWYRSSSKPGFGGTMLIDGHNGGPNIEGVFKHLPNLAVGDIITIERGDGKFFRYEVVENKEIPLSQADNYMETALNSPVWGKESLTLITCSGDWSQVQDTYLSRQFVRATKIEDNTDYTTTELKNELKEKREAEAKKAEEEKNGETAEPQPVDQLNES